MKKYNPLQILFDFIVPALGIVIMVISLGYGFGTLKRPGPGLYPFFIGLSLSIFGIFLLLVELRKPTLRPLLDSGEIPIFLSMIAAFCLWVLLMPLLGYLAVTLVTAFGFAKIMKLEGWWKPLLVSAGTTFFVYLLFDVWLYIDLPKGILS